MWILIDIPEEIYERFGYEYREESAMSKHTNDIILDAFCNGTPLPKNHGKLIDAEKLKQLHRESLESTLIDNERKLDLSRYADVACDKFDAFIDSCEGIK